MNGQKRRWRGERVDERITIRLSASDRDRLDALVIREGTSQSEVARKAISAWLARIEPENS